MARALIPVDIQTGFNNPYWGARNTPDAEEKAGQLLAHRRKQGWPVFLVQHLSTNPDITTPHCVSTTCRMGTHTAWRNRNTVDPERIHQAAIDHIAGEFAAICSTKEALA